MKAQSQTSKVMVDSRLLREVATATPAEALAILKTTPQGLTPAQVAERIREYGRNEVAHEKPRAWYVQLAESFRSPFTGVLLVLAIISYVTDVRLATDTYYYLYMTVIVGIFAVGAGAALLTDDEERGILDLVMAHPVSRTALFWGRWLAFAVATTGILLLGWLGWLPFAHRVGLNLTWLQFLLPNVPLLAELLLFGALALLLSMVLPSRSSAAALAGALLAANWLLRGLAGVDKDLQAIMNWTPLYFYQGGLAVDGLKWSWLVILLGTTLLLTLLAMFLFQRRDIRVGGERSWSLPVLGGRRKNP